MYAITKQADKTQTYVQELIADTTADIDSIPTTGLKPGSTVIVLEDSTVYMLNTEKEWKKL